MIFRLTVLFSLGKAKALSICSTWFPVVRHHSSGSSDARLGLSHSGFLFLEKELWSVVTS